MADDLRTMVQQALARRARERQQAEPMRFDAVLAAIAAPPPEQTILSRQDEAAFRVWAAAEGITDVDHPQSFYDYRGYWKDLASKGQDRTEINAQDQQRHFPDTYKQHGHPTFSQESQYSAGPRDGGMWVGEAAGAQLLDQPPLAVSHAPAAPPFTVDMAVSHSKPTTGLEAEHNATPKTAEPVWFSRLTPEMRENIRKNGLSLLSIAAILKLADEHQEPEPKD